MSNAVLEKYRTIAPSNDQQIVEAMWRKMLDLTEEQAKFRWHKSEETGFVFLFTDERYPGYVLEYVQGTKNDSVTTLYKYSREFATLKTLAGVREDLIREIGRVLLSIPGAVLVRDEGREREVTLKELGTAQLQDVLAHFTATDITTI